MSPSETRAIGIFAKRIRDLLAARNAVLSAFADRWVINLDPDDLAGCGYVEAMAQAVRGEKRRHA
jgi:hypothetical protein